MTQQGWLSNDNNVGIVRKRERKSTNNYKQKKNYSTINYNFKKLSRTQPLSAVLTVNIL